MSSRFATLGRIPCGVWILGGVSLLMDVSSEMIHSLLPLFMATTLGVSVIVIGLIEGLAEATALIVKVFSGVLSDYLGKRKGLALLFFGLKEPAAVITDKRTHPITRANLRLLGRGYWWVVGIGAVFTLARFSEAFLVLKAQQGGTPLALIPLVMVAMNLVYACSAYPFGKLSDRMSHKGMLKAGLLVLIAADVVLALSDNWAGVLFGVALWGVHMGMTQGLLAAMVAHTAPAHLRGTAFGMFNLVSGVALLLASLGAGMLWELVGSASTFYAGAIVCVVTLIGMQLAPFDNRQGV
ncbi:MFS transporter [Serratia sp. TKO39]|uniref:MFS transporter n=1 Tax=Serratia sp. TKO39 TaxID=2052589 RepID=UPI000C2409D5|nr:MFS transporter [Serratia sp. TKO39]PJI70319.1 hypothetical protein CUN64_03660 [Serratia sp. TKO39]